MWESQWFRFTDELVAEIVPRDVDMPKFGRQTRLGAISVGRTCGYPGIVVVHPVAKV